MGVMICEGGGGTPPFSEQAFYARLCRFGRAFGITVYVFSPLWADMTRRTVNAYEYDPESAEWVQRTFPLPDLVYDRSFFTGRSPLRCRMHRSAVRRLLQAKPVLLLGRGLKGKWEVLQMLRRDPQLRPHLPATERVTDWKTIGRRLPEWSCLFVKPEHGSRGIGALQIGAGSRETAWRVRGRAAGNRTVDREFADIATLAAWLCRFAGSRPYLCQPYLSLRSRNGAVYDVRSLVQKNGGGRWELTGMAVRLGQSGSVTSNLYGGGHAEEVRPFLTAEFGPDRAERIIRTLHRLSERIPLALEAANGRMAELGLDFGIDRDGRVWIIEANSKPGRNVFSQLRQEAEQSKAARQPVAYARYLLDRSRPSRIGPALQTSGCLKSF